MADSPLIGSEAEIVGMFRALGDPRRFAILSDLAKREGPARVTDLTACCGIDFSGVSRHLKTLRDAGLVIARKQGRETLYTIDRAALSGISTQIGHLFDEL